MRTNPHRELPIYPQNTARMCLALNANWTLSGKYLVLASFRENARGLCPFLSYLPTTILGLTLLVFASGCATPAQTAGLVVGGVTLAGATIPASAFEQIYYLGVFDPEEQLPPAMYRITVRGQSSFLNSTKFASGWVPASTIDSLTGTVSINGGGPNDGATVTAGNENAGFKVGRRLVMFGPEGFREAPANHRLVVVMGADPSGYFKQIDQALGEISSGATAARDSDLINRILQEMTEVNTTKNRAQQLRIELAESTGK